MFAKKIISAFIALSFIFVAEAFARKGNRHRDNIERTKISQKLKSDKKREEQKKRALRAQQKKNLQLIKRRRAQLKKAEKKKTLELKRKQKAQLGKRKSTSSNSSRTVQKKKQEQEQLKKVQAAKPAPKVFKEPTPYYVKVRDLPKDQQKQAAKYMGLRNPPKEGTIKFAHSDLDPQKTPTFKEFLDIKERNIKAQKKNSSGFEIFEYKDKNGSTFYSLSNGYSSEKSNKKDSNWSWPWNSSEKSNKKDSNWSWPWNK